MRRRILFFENEIRGTSPATPKARGTRLRNIPRIPLSKSNVITVRLTLRRFSRKEASHTARIKRLVITAAFVVFGLAVSVAADPLIDSPKSEPAKAADPVDLLKQYPTTLTVGDTDPTHARQWQFDSKDIFALSQFDFAAGDLRVKTGAADLGIGHCKDGAVYAIVIPRDKGELTSKAAGGIETISHVWLRFHPKEISRLFPAGTVTSDVRTNLFWQMRLIATAKIFSSWQADGKAMIPGPKDVTVDIDTQAGVRRFFMVDNEAHTAEYVKFFEADAIKLPPEFSSELAADAFDKLWNAFDGTYAGFAIRPEVNWQSMRERYRPVALASKSTYEFASVCAEMLKPLRDLHVWLSLAGAPIPVFNRVRASNANPRGSRTILNNIAEDSGGEGGLFWAITTNNIGYISIQNWSDPEISSQCDEALEKMRNTRGLIFDVRLNSGGSEPLAKEVAGRFLEKEFVYAYNQYRNGPSHTNLTEKIPRKVAPRGPWRYNRPVLLLIGQKCMSSNESFIGMMTGDPALITFGDHTCGSSGNPQMVQLPLDITVSVPQWIDYRPDDVPLDEHGFEPKIQFTPGPGAFDGDRDDLLTNALARVAQFKLPATPIAGPSIDSNNPESALFPKVISVIPTNGAADLSAVTQLRIRFDRPMDPLSLKLDWKSGGFLDCAYSEYDSNRYEFTIPIHLVPGALQRVAVNQPEFGSASESRKFQPRDGFQSEDHELAQPYSWSFRTQPAQTQEQPIPVMKRISPAAGSIVPCRTFVEIQFDQPMAAPEIAPLWISTGAGPLKAPQMFDPTYNAADHTFRIPFIFPTNDVAQLTIHGFQSAVGVPARPVDIRYRVSSAELSDEEQQKLTTQIQDARLQSLLRDLKAQRLQLTSVAERIQDTLLLRSDHAGQFVGLDSKQSAFKWQQPNQFFADVTAPMMSCTDFRIGCDGKQWWYHVTSSADTNIEFQICPVNGISELNISICDPFGLLDDTPANASRDFELNYLGASDQSKSNPGSCVVHGWQINRSNPDMLGSAQLVWRIDSKSKTVIDLTETGSRFEVRRRFFYDALNASLPESDFAVPKFKGLTPAAPEPLDSDYTNRFINLRDGQDGHMGARWGKKGPKGTYSSGLN